MIVEDHEMKKLPKNVDGEFFWPYSNKIRPGYFAKICQKVIIGGHINRETFYSATRGMTPFNARFEPNISLHLITLRSAEEKLAAE